MKAEAATPQTDRRSIVLICILIFAVAFGIRLPGIGWGLKNDLHNESYHPDEPQIFDFAHHTNIFHSPDFKQYYNYGTLYYAILRGADTVGQAVGAIHKPESLDANIATADPKTWDNLTTYVSQADLWGRFVSALAGAGTCVLVFLILRRWTTVLGAIAGAALIAFSPAHVEHSRFQTVDVVSLFFVALGTLAVVRLLRQDIDPEKWTWEVVLASVIIGCSASTRYTDALMMLPLWLIIGVKRPKSWVALVIFAPIIAFVSFIATTPGFITDSDYFWQNFNYQVAHAQGGHDLVFVGRPSGFIYHIYLLIVGISGPAVAVGLAGLLYAAIRGHGWARAILLFFIAYYVSIGRLDTMFLRYGFPLYIGVACGFGYAISAIQRRSNNKWIGLAIAVLSLAGFDNPQAGLRGTYLFTKWMAWEQDPRDEIGSAMKEASQKTPNLDIGIIGSGPWFYTAALMKDSSVLYFQPKGVQAQMLAATHDPRVVSFTSGATPMYATYSSYEVEDGLRLKNRSDVDITVLGDIQIVNEQVRILNERYQLVSVVGDDGPGVHDLEYIRPTIWLLKRRD